MTRRRRLPASITYGYSALHESLALFEAGHLERLSRETSAIQACSSLRELERLLPGLTTAPSPIHADDFDAAVGETGLDADWDWQECGAVADGDWPVMATANALELFPLGHPVLDALIARAGCEVVSTSDNGPYLFIPPERERDLVSVLAERGVVALRDDALVRPLVPE